MTRRSYRGFWFVASAALISSAGCRSAQRSAERSAIDAVAPAVVVRASPAGFEGEWSTTFGSMRLSRFGERVGGYYGDLGRGAWIEGRVVEGRFDFRYREPQEHGEGWFELSDDGASFSGRWKADGSEDWADWGGERSEALELAADCSGVWTTSYGTLRLEQNGAQVRGTYSRPMGSQLAGELRADVLRGVYNETDGTRGRFVFEFSSDREQFRGVWRPDAEAPLELEHEDAHVWTGKRAHPTPGRKWLIVLEAHWETSLAERPYSYGAILEKFFERVPQVEVRHRYFHDAADFARQCAELRELLEPVTLYVSSHGSRDGIGAGAEVLDAQSVGRALFGAHNLQLVHFGGCELLAGDFAAQVREAAGGAFPISGFEVSVDWAASAIVDLTYMHLVLERGMTPADAAAAVRSMLSFARSAEGQDDPLPATHFSLSPAK